MELRDIIGLGGVALIVALVEAVKRIMPDLEPRWYPAVAVFWGMVINVGFALSQIGDLKLAIVYGLLAGLVACGLYSGGATVGIRS